MDDSNSRERVMLAVDISSEMMDKTCARPGDPLNQDRLVRRINIVKDALLRFVELKSKFNPLHLFGLCVLTDTVDVIQDYTSNIGAFKQCIKNICVDTSCGKNLTLDFEKLFLNPIIHSEETSRITHLVIVYGRSYELPSLSNRELCRNVIDSRNFFFDIIYLHAPKNIHLKQSTDLAPYQNRPKRVCQEVYDFLSDLESHRIEKDGISYFFEMATNGEKLLRSFALCLSSPKQRKPQHELEYREYSL